MGLYFPWFTLGKHLESDRINTWFFFLFLKELLYVSNIFYLTHCHTILPTNWLLGNMALWMGCIFISVCSGLDMLRGEKHPNCSPTCPVCNGHSGFVWFVLKIIIMMHSVHQICTGYSINPEDLKKALCHKGLTRLHLLMLHKPTLNNNTFMRFHTKYPIISKIRTFVWHLCKCNKNKK